MERSAAVSSRHPGRPHRRGLAALVGIVAAIGVFATVAASLTPQATAQQGSFDLRADDVALDSPTGEATISIVLDPQSTPITVLALDVTADTNFVEFVGVETTGAGPCNDIDRGLVRYGGVQALGWTEPVEVCRVLIRGVGAGGTTSITIVPTSAYDLTTTAVAGPTRTVTVSLGAAPDPTATPTPEPSPSQPFDPEPTATAQPTATPEPTAAPAATPTSEATSEPTPDPAPTAEAPPAATTPPSDESSDSSSYADLADDDDTYDALPGDDDTNVDPGDDAGNGDDSATERGTRQSGSGDAEEPEQDLTTGPTSDDPADLVADDQEDATPILVPDPDLDSITVRGGGQGDGAPTWLIGTAALALFGFGGYLAARTRRSAGLDLDGRDDDRRLDPSVADLVDRDDLGLG